jgi:putative DNA primase/helicase
VFHEKTTHAAKGKWKGILMTFGLPADALTGKHSKCPLCGSKDNFRFDNKDQRGTYICTCGAGDGMKLAMEYTGRSFRDLAPAIDEMLGNVTPDTCQPQAGLSADQIRDALRDTYRATEVVKPGDLVDRYLQSRGVGDTAYPDGLRFAPKLRDGDGGIRPAMVAMVVDVAGKPVSMHRTFLKSDGSGKAEMQNPRKMMPGTLPEGACVRLSEFVPGGALGIAEGIETALAASALFEMPVWSAINTAILKKWMPPEGCQEVAIFADNDAKFGGQGAAYTLAHRLAVKGARVTVHVPDRAGRDWNDVLLAATAQNGAAA